MSEEHFDHHRRKHLTEDEINKPVHEEGEECNKEHKEGEQENFARTGGGEPDPGH